MSDAQSVRIQRARDNGARISCIEEKDDGSVEIEFGWGWLTLDASGREQSRVNRNDVHISDDDKVRI